MSNYYDPIGFALDIFKKRYTLHDQETWLEACDRVAGHVASAEHGDLVPKYKQEFSELLKYNLFMPGGRIWYGSGRPKGQLLNCFVSDISSDSREGWGQTVSDMIVITGTGGGLGINGSPIRPRGTPINGTGGQATGAVSLFEIINSAGEVIKAGGGRRTALMLCLNINHGDIEEFLDKKLDLKQLNNANVSVVFNENPEDFFNKVKNNESLQLKFREKIVGEVSAKKLWDKIVLNALKSGEPGLLNGYLANKTNNIWWYKSVNSTNPCGEQWLEDGGSCCLGAIVLPRFVGNDIDWQALKNTVRISVRFLDNVLSVNNFPLARIKENCLNVRRIGLGVMGVHDMLLRLNLRYNSDSGLELTNKVMNFIKNCAYETSIELAVEKGSFPKFDAHLFLKSGFIKTLKPSIRSKIEEKGIRNCALLTIAPTGTTSMVSGVSSGIEPMFAPAYVRRYRDGDKISKEVVIHPLLKEFIDTGRSVKHFQGAFDIKLRDHFEMQRVCQRNLDNACSKCLATGTLIPTDQGLISIESFSNIEIDDSFNIVKNIKTSNGEKIISHYRLGVAPATRIRLNNGAELVGATASHKVETSEGWKLMSALSVGDRVLGKLQKTHGIGSLPINYDDVFLANSNKIVTPKKMSPELAEWLGMLASDGHTTESTGCVSICWKDKPEVEKRFIELSRNIFDITPKIIVDKRNGVCSGIITSRNLVRFVRSLIGNGAYNKYVPTQILQGNENEKLAFISGITLDGYYDHRRGLCVYGGMSKKLAYQSSEVCRSFGLPSVYVSTKVVKSNGENCYCVFVSDILQEHIKAIEVHKNGPVIYKKRHVLLDRKLLDIKVECSHPNYSAVRALRQDIFRDYCTNELAESFGWPTDTLIHHVTRVEDAGLVEMFDIEVEGSHSYVVNGIVSHNTINVPKGTSVKELSDLYMEYLPELKGVTVYPEGSREDQPLTPLPLEEAVKYVKKDALIEARALDPCKDGKCDI